MKAVINFQLKITWFLNILHLLLYYIELIQTLLKHLNMSVFGYNLDFLILLGIITKNIDIGTFDIAAMLTIYLKRDQDLYKT